MPNQTFDRSHHSIPRHTSEPTAPLRRGASVAQSVILQSVWPLVLLLALGLSSLAFFSAPNIIGLFHDDGIYTVVAKALSEGDGYRIISLPGEPYQTKYPFLYSYLLSWAWSFNPQFPDNISLLNFVTVFSYFAALLLAYVLYVQNSDGGKSDALLYVFLVGANACVFSMTSYPLSDIPFMAACALLSWPYPIPANNFPTRTKAIVLLSASVGIAFIFRPAGAALILAGLVLFFSPRKRKQFYLLCCDCRLPHTSLAPLAGHARLSLSITRFLPIINRTKVRPFFWLLPIPVPHLRLSGTICAIWFFP